MTRSRNARLALAFFAASCLTAPLPAAAQLISNDAWRAPPTNRASIAFAMKDVEDGRNGAGLTTVTSTSIVCGGGQGATATANSNCIILNDATGAITTDQDSDGDQGASTTDNSTTTNNGTQADELMDLLGID